MFKKLFCILVSLILIANLTFLATAEVEPMMLHDGKNAFGDFKSDKDGEKGDCVAYHFSGGASSFVSGVKFAPKDASGCDTLVIDVYLSDLEILAGLTDMYIEITSSGTCDHEENAWVLHNHLKSGKLEQGWNTVYLYLSDSMETDGKCDLSAINFIRIFSTFNGSALAGKTIKFDNIRMIWTGGYDYSDVNLDFYRGDNLDTDIIIKGQAAPDLANRHANITTAIGR